MVFLDASAFIAAASGQDAYHRQAAKVWPRLQDQPLFTSRLAIAETVTVLARHTQPAFAVEAGRAIYRMRHLTILDSTREHDLAALADLGRFNDRKLSFADALAFVLMKERGIRQVFTFDRRHFGMAGFEIWQDQFI